MINIMFQKCPFKLNTSCDIDSDFLINNNTTFLRTQVLRGHRLNNSSSLYRVIEWKRKAVLYDAGTLKNLLRLPRGHRWSEQRRQERHPKSLIRHGQIAKAEATTPCTDSNKPTCLQQLKRGQVPRHNQHIRRYNYADNHHSFDATCTILPRTS